MSKYKLCVFLITTDTGTEADFALVHDFNTEAAAERAREWFANKNGATALVIHDDPEWGQK